MGRKINTQRMINTAVSFLGFFCYHWTLEGLKPRTVQWAHRKNSKRSRFSLARGLGTGSLQHRVWRGMGKRESQCFLFYSLGLLHGKPRPRSFTLQYWEHRTYDSERKHFSLAAGTEKRGFLGEWGEILLIFSLFSHCLSLSREMSDSMRRLKTPVSSPGTREGPLGTGV